MTTKSRRAGRRYEHKYWYSTRKTPARRRPPEHPTLPHSGLLAQPAEPAELAGRHVSRPRPDEWRLLSSIFNPSVSKFDNLLVVLVLPLANSAGRENVDCVLLLQVVGRNTSAPSRGCCRLEHSCVKHPHGGVASVQLLPQVPVPLHKPCSCFNVVLLTPLSAHGTSGDYYHQTLFYWPVGVHSSGPRAPLFQLNCGLWYL